MPGRGIENGGVPYDPRNEPRGKDLHPKQPHLRSVGGFPVGMDSSVIGGSRLILSRGQIEARRRKERAYAARHPKGLIRRGAETAIGGALSAAYIAPMIPGGHDGSHGVDIGHAASAAADLGVTAIGAASNHVSDIGPAIGKSISGATDAITQIGNQVPKLIEDGQKKASAALSDLAQKAPKAINAAIEGTKQVAGGIVVGAIELANPSGCAPTEVITPTPVSAGDILIGPDGNRFVPTPTQKATIGAGKPELTIDMTPVPPATVLPSPAPSATKTITQSPTPTETISPTHEATKVPDWWTTETGRTNWVNTVPIVKEDANGQFVNDERPGDRQTLRDLMDILNSGPQTLDPQFGDKIGAIPRGADPTNPIKLLDKITLDGIKLHGNGIFFDTRHIVELNLNLNWGGDNNPSLRARKIVNAAGLVKEAWAIRWLQTHGDPEITVDTKTHALMLTIIKYWSLKNDLDPGVRSELKNLLKGMIDLQPLFQ